MNSWEMHWGELRHLKMKVHGSPIECEWKICGGCYLQNIFNLGLVSIISWIFFSTWILIPHQPVIRG